METTRAIHCHRIENNVISGSKMVRISQYFNSPNANVEVEIAASMPVGMENFHGWNIRLRRMQCFVSVVGVLGLTYPEA